MTAVNQQYSHGKAVNGNGINECSPNSNRPTSAPKKSTDTSALMSIIFMIADILVFLGISLGYTMQVSIALPLAEGKATYSLLHVR